jgi:hypothetical protein
MLFEAKPGDELGGSRSHLFPHTVEIVPVAHSLQFSFFMLEFGEATLISRSLSAPYFFLACQTILFSAPAIKK